MGGTTTLEVTKDHAVGIAPSTGGTATIQNIAGGSVLNFGDDSQLSVDTGTIAAGSSQVFGHQVWIKSTGLSTVIVVLTDASGGGGGAIAVTDGTNTAPAATTLDFTSGGTVTDLGGGIAGVAVSGGSGSSILWGSGVLFVSHVHGNDANSGTAVAPFQTISAAVNSLSTDTATIFVDEGNYVENVLIFNNPVVIIGAGTPGYQTGTKGTTIVSPDDVTNAIDIIGSSANGTRIYGVCTGLHSATSKGVGINVAGASYGVIDYWQHRGPGTPTKTVGGTGLAMCHGEQWSVNQVQISASADGVIFGVEGDEEAIDNLHISQNFREIFSGPYEGFRAPITSNINATVSTIGIGKSALLPSGPAFGYTQDFLAAPSAPVPTTATSGGTILAGVYQAKVAYTNAYGETIASSSGSITTTGSTSTITVPSPGALAGATGWYAYVTQVGGSSYTRQQAAGSPTAIGTGLTLTAPPTSTGSQPQSGTSAYATEGLWWPTGGNSGNSLSSVQRAIVGYLTAGINNSQTTGLIVAGLSPGNTAFNGMLNPFLVSNVPSSGTMIIDPGLGSTETITYTSITSNGNGTWTLNGVTRSGSPSSHSALAACQDNAKASAASHAQNTFIVMSAGSGFSGAWAGGSTIRAFKSASCQAQNPGDATVELYSSILFERPDFSESGNTNTPRIHQSAIGTKFIYPSFASATTITDDGQHTTYESPSGGAIVLSTLSQNCAVENNLGTTVTDLGGTANRLGALRMDTAAGSIPVVDSATALVDQHVLIYDAASGKLKGTAILQLPAGVTAGDTFYYNGSTLSRVAIGSNGNVWTVQGGVPVWTTPSASSGRQQLLLTALGLVSENVRAVTIANSAALTSQQINCGLVPLANGDIITNIAVNVITAGSGTAPTLIRLGIADRTGKILAVTADVHSDSQWTSTGYKQFPLSAPLTVGTSDSYYVCVLENGAFGTTALRLLASSATAAQLLVIGSGNAPWMWQNSQTDLPAVNSSMTLIAGGSSTPWFGVN